MKSKIDQLNERKWEENGRSKFVHWAIRRFLPDFKKALDAYDSVAGELFGEGVFDEFHQSLSTYPELSNFAKYFGYPQPGNPDDPLVSMWGQTISTLRMRNPKHRGRVVTPVSFYEKDYTVLKGIVETLGSRRASLTLRVAARHVQASLLGDFRHKMVDLLRDPVVDVEKAKEVSVWMEANFFFLAPKTPKGQKEIKSTAEKLHWWLRNLGMYQDRESVKRTVQDTWSDLDHHLTDFVRHFSPEGSGKSVPKEIKLSGVTFINGAGLEEAKLHAYAERFLSIFKELRGWRKKALSGDVKVRLATPKDFGGGTAAGKYRSNDDEMWVRATPAVLKRGAGYASIDYIIVHELGHRYERKNHVPVDFDRSEWWTTPYSKETGESFAELFALTNFGITSAHTSWDPQINERFEKLMG